MSTLKTTNIKHASSSLNNIVLDSSGNVGIGSSVPQAKLDIVGGVNGTIVLGTSQSVSGLGTAVTFTGIPSWVKRVTVMFSEVSTSGTSRVLVQLGKSVGFTISGYVCTSTILNATIQTPTTSTAGFIVDGASATDNRTALATICNVTGSQWICSVHGKCSTDTTITGGGSVDISGTLDRVRITTVNGTDTFDVGSINIMYEG